MTLMNMFGLKGKTVFPEFLENRCVHEQLETATCQSCVDVCPQNAWLLTDDALALDQDACDGCGLCAPACPQMAIQWSAELSLVTRGQQAWGLVACEKTKASLGQNCVVPCLHVFGIRALLEQVGRGLEGLLVQHGDCDQCLRGSVISLQANMNSANDILASVNGNQLKYQELSVRDWREQRKFVQQVITEQDLSRRAFFRLLPEHIEELEKAEDSSQTNRLPPIISDELLSDSSASVVWPCVPEIGESSCHACHACVRVCPQEALALDQTDGRSNYILDPQQCTGCGLCVDICGENAILIEHMKRQVQYQVDLSTEKCTYCGVTFNWPENNDTGKKGFCSVCASHGEHYKNLFQVLD